MAELLIPKLPVESRSVAAWVAVLLHSLARDEQAGRRPQRLTEAGLGTWTRFSGRLTAADFVALLFEDAAVLSPIPFEPSAMGTRLELERLPSSLTEQWLNTVGELDLGAPSHEYVTAQADALGLPTRLARSDLHVVKPHQKVLELPGTGGQLAHHLIRTQGDLLLQDNFLISCASWQESTLAGLVALELASPHTRFIVPVEVDDLLDPEHPVRRQTFDFVIGLDPEKGGRFQAEEQLQIWFSQAKVLLV